MSLLGNCFQILTCLVTTSKKLSLTTINQLQFTRENASGCSADQNLLWLNWGRKCDLWSLELIKNMGGRTGCFWTETTAGKLSATQIEKCGAGFPQRSGSGVLCPSCPKCSGKSNPGFKRCSTVIPNCWSWRGKAALFGALSRSTFLCPLTLPELFETQLDYVLQLYRLKLDFNK